MIVCSSGTIGLLFESQIWSNWDWVWNMCMAVESVNYWSDLFRHMVEFPVVGALNQAFEHMKRLSVRTGVERNILDNLFCLYILVKLQEKRMTGNWASLICWENTVQTEWINILWLWSQRRRESEDKIWSKILPFFFFNLLFWWGIPRQHRVPTV